MWRVGVIILPALIAQATAQNLRNNWVGMSESKLGDRAHKAQNIQDLDSTMLMKGSAMPQQSFTSTVARATDAFKGRVPNTAALQIPFLSKGSMYRTAHHPYSSVANRIHNDHFPRQTFVRADRNTMQATKALETQDLTSVENSLSHEQKASFLPQEKVALFLMVAHAIVHEAMMPSKGK